MHPRTSPVQKVQFCAACFIEWMLFRLHCMLHSRHLVLPLQAIHMYVDLLSAVQ